MSDEDRASRIEIVTAVVLATAGLLTSWAGYQASLWDGAQAAHYNRATALRVQASQAAMNADALRAVEVNLFSSWLAAKSAGNERLAGFYQQRFPTDLKAAFTAWMAQQPLQNPNAASSPFDLPDYRLRGGVNSKMLEGKADAEFEAGQRANNASDGYSRGTVALATAMFFGGIAQVFRSRGVRGALVIVALIACAVGIERIVRLPAMFASS